jgi:hypothetical protein
MARQIGAITKAKSECQQSRLRCVLKDRGESLVDSVDLVAAFKLDVLWSDFPVQRQITCGTGMSYPKRFTKSV